MKYLCNIYKFFCYTKPKFVIIRLVYKGGDIIKELNAYIYYKTINQERYQYYSSIYVKKKKKKIICPTCKNCIIVMCHYLETKDIEKRKCKTGQNCIYIEGTIDKIFDDNTFMYNIVNNESSFLISPIKEGISRIFIRSGMRMIIAGKLFFKIIKKTKRCPFCNSVLHYNDKIYGIKENISKIILKEGK